MKKMFSPAFFLFMTASLFLFYLPLTAGVKWSLIWSDEFNGNVLNTNYWSFDIGRGSNNDGYGSWSLETFTDSPENCSVSNGFLILRIVDDQNGKYVSSAQVTTKDKKTFYYGKIEARIKLPRGYGMWPGFCMFGTNIDSAGWPECGEIDVMEMRGGDHGDSNRTIFGTLHFRNGSKSDFYPDKWTYEQATFRLPSDTDFSRDFHVFGIIWDKEKIIFFVDDTPYRTNWIRSFLKTEFRLPFYLYFNIKTGGEFYAYRIKSKDELSGTLPQSMLIDWVRYYRKD
jgi:beta-glucanase (GH16 family)